MPAGLYTYGGNKDLGDDTSVLGLNAGPLPLGGYAAFTAKEFDYFDQHYYLSPPGSQYALDADLDAEVAARIAAFLPDAHDKKIFRAYTFGNYEDAVAASIVANPIAWDETATQVGGAWNPSFSAERGSVAQYLANYTRSTYKLDSTATTFAADGVTVPAGVDVSGIKRGMVIDVGAADPFVTSEVERVDLLPGGAHKVVTQWYGWYQSGAAAATPANGTRVRVDRQMQIWGLNLNVFVLNASDPQPAVGIELGVYSARDDSTVLLANSEGAGSRGYDVIALSAAGKPLFGMTARGRFKYGYSASGMAGDAAGRGAGYVYHKAHIFTPGSTVEAAYLDEDSNAVRSFYAKRAAATDKVLEALVVGEANPRVSLNAKGDLLVGPGSAAPQSIMPWQYEIGTLTTAILETGAWGVFQAGTYLYGGVKTSSGAQNEEIGWDVVLAAGTWRVILLHHKDPSRGIYTIRLDGVDTGQTIDGYSAAGATNSVSQSGDIVVAQTGKKRLSLKMATKAGAASAYYAALQHVKLVRTA